MPPFDPGEEWIVYNRAALRNTQGWKLHVSANPRDLPSALSCTRPILDGHGVSYKTVRNADVLAQLSRSLTQIGKAVTVYPRSDTEAVQVAHELADALEGMRSPRIPSDKRLRPRNALHYRYGSFSTVKRYDRYGNPMLELIAPNGSPEQDPRTPFYKPPSWAHDPFTLEEFYGKRDGDIIFSRYDVKRVRTSPKSLSLIASSRANGREVFIKRVISDISYQYSYGREAALYEAHVLSEINGDFGSPTLLELLFDDDYSYLVESATPSESFFSYTYRRVMAGTPLDDDVFLQCAQQCVDLVASFHASGWVIGDLSPGNLILKSAGGVGIVDFEGMSRVGQPHPALATPGFEVRDNLLDPLRRDWLVLAGCLFFFATGAQPYSSGSYARSLSWIREAIHRCCGTSAPIIRRQIEAVLRKAGEER